MSKHTDSIIKPILVFIVLFVVLLILSMIPNLPSSKVQQELTDENKQLKIDNSSLEFEIMQLERQIDELTLEIESLEDGSNSSSIKSSSETTTITSSSFTLTNGSYTVSSTGTIKPGTYDLEAVSGYGSLKVDAQSGFVSMGFGVSERYPDHKSYNGLELVNGDTVDISNGVSIKFKR